MQKLRILVLKKSLPLIPSIEGCRIIVIDAIKDFNKIRAPDLVILERLKNLKELRRHSEVPIIMILSRDTAFERIAYLENGADDCVARPVNARELLARIRTVLRRASASFEWRFKGLVIEEGSRSVVWHDRHIKLTTAEFDLLKLLAKRAPEALSREFLFKKLKGVEWEPTDRSIDILASRLRDKLGDSPRRPRFIRTVRNVGYQFAGKPDLKLRSERTSFHAHSRQTLSSHL